MASQLKSPVRRLSLAVQVLFSLTVAILISGCASTPKAAMPTPGQNWTTDSGQLRYRPKSGKSVIGDVVVRRSGEDFLLVFTSGPGVPLIKLQTHGSTATAEGIFARASWSGDVSKAPQNLRGWVSLPGIFAKAVPNTPEIRNAGLSARLSYAGGRPQGVDVTSAETGEQFTFHFAR
jgi:hypothetical protein